MKRGARFRAGGRSGRWEVQLRGGRSRVTPCAPASERPLALSSSLRCKSELQILMRGKYRSGGARPARSRPPPAPGCVRSHGDAGEGPGPPPPRGPSTGGARGGLGRDCAPTPPTGPICPDRQIEATGLRANWPLESSGLCDHAGSPGARRWGCERSARGRSNACASRGVEAGGRDTHGPARAPLRRLPPTR